MNKKNIKFSIMIGFPLLLGVLVFFGVPQSLLSTQNNLPEKTSGSIQFFEDSHDFGVFDEGKLVTFRFEFENLGTEAVSITNVRASCGCTTPSYSRKPVKPNEMGYIDVEYNSNGRPGAFSKNVYVENNGTPDRIVLKITGKVIPAPITGKDLTTQGGFLISEGVIDVGNWKKGVVFKHDLKIQNTSDYPIKIQSFEADDDVKLSLPPYSILPGEKVNIPVLFQADPNRKSGKFNSVIKLKTNDKETPIKTIDLRGSLIGTTQGSVLSPKIEFNKTYIDLGDVVQHDKVNVNFAFKNTGEGELKILDVEPSCGCTVVDKLKSSYAAGEGDEVKAVLDAEDKFGIIRKEITVKTNDPNKEEIVLILEANVIEHPNKEKMAAMRAAAGENASIFKGECRSCHVDRGVGKSAKELYTASCQMCHGPAAKKDDKQHPGNLFTKEYLAAIPEALLQKYIAEGTPNEKKKGMMPGFQTDFGGPLTQDQVSSLTAYLKSLPQNLN